MKMCLKVLRRFRGGMINENRFHNTRTSHLWFVGRFRIKLSQGSIELASRSRSVLE